MHLLEVLLSLSLVSMATAGFGAPSTVPPTEVLPPSSEVPVTTKSPAIDGGVGPWAEWDTCSAKCGETAIQTRVRACDNPLPQHGGADCSEPLSETKDCYVIACPTTTEVFPPSSTEVPATTTGPVVGPWAEWGTCSATCGEGTRKRTRACNGGADCTEPLSETTSCNEKPCPIVGGAGPWGEWGTCSATCGGGTHTRTRACDNPAPQFGGANCSEPLSETTSCNAEPCEYFDVFNTGKADWRLVFRGTPYIKKSVFSAFINEQTGEVDVGCKTLASNVSCGQHYRNNPAINAWTKQHQVLFAIYKDGAVAQWIKFRATNGAHDIQSWFSKERMESSSWTTIKTAPKTNAFKMDCSNKWGGSTERQFYVSRQHKNCPGDKGWFVAIDTITKVVCEWEKLNTFPVFMYSTKSNAWTQWSDREYAKADFIAIFTRKP